MKLPGGGMVNHKFESHISRTSSLKNIKVKSEACGANSGGGYSKFFIFVLKGMELARS